MPPNPGEPLLDHGRFGLLLFFHTGRGFGTCLALGARDFSCMRAPSSSEAGTWSSSTWARRGGSGVSSSSHSGLWSSSSTVWRTWPGRGAAPVGRQSHTYAAQSRQYPAFGIAVSPSTPLPSTTSRHHRLLQGTFTPQVIAHASRRERDPVAPTLPGPVRPHVPNLSGISLPSTPPSWRRRRAGCWRGPS